MKLLLHDPSHACHMKPEASAPAGSLTLLLTVLNFYAVGCCKRLKRLAVCSEHCASESRTGCLAKFMI